MSIYYINQNFSIRDRFTIKDKNQKDLFFAEGKLLSIGKRITLRTSSYNGWREFIINQRKNVSMVISI